MMQGRPRFFKTIIFSREGGGNIANPKPQGRICYNVLKTFTKFRFEPKRAYFLNAPLKP